MYSERQTTHSVDQISRDRTRPVLTLSTDNADSVDKVNYDKTRPVLTLSTRIVRQSKQYRPDQVRQNKARINPNYSDRQTNQTV